MKEYKIIQGQTIFDVAVQEYGSIEGFEQILRDNDGVDMETVLLSEQIINIDEERILNTPIVNFFKTNSIKIVNMDGIGDFEEEQVKIGFWVTEESKFVVTETGNKIKVN